MRVAKSIVACDECGILISDHVFPIEKHKYKDDGTIDDELFTWDGYEYVPYIKCPCCDSNVTKE